MNPYSTHENTDVFLQLARLGVTLSRGCLYSWLSMVCHGSWKFKKTRVLYTTVGIYE